MGKNEIKKDLSEMTKDELLKEQILREERAKKKAITDQILRFIGVLTSIFMFIMIFSQLSLISWFSFVNGQADTGINFWVNLFESEAGQNSIAYKVFYNTQGAASFAATVMTLIQISLAIVVGFLIAYYIKDAIGVIKSIFKLGKDITHELGVGLKEGVQDLGVVIPKKKSLFNEEEPKVEAVPEKKRGRKSKEEIEKEKAKKTLESLGVPVEPVKAIDPLDALTTEQQDAVLQGKAKIQDFIKSTEPSKKALFEE